MAKGAPTLPPDIQKNLSLARAAHTLLDIGGLAPVVGWIFDGGNALIYAVHGKYAYAGISAAAAVPIIGEAATVGEYAAKTAKYADETVMVTKSVGKKAYTKSNLKLGREMHKAYRKDEVMKGIREKEFVLPSRKRIDFEKKTIYELKPHNPRAMRQGFKQLYRYKQEIENLYGTGWKMQLDLY